MKSMMIIPIFISHMGCQNTCVFCNQRHINGVSQMPRPEDIESQIETYLASATAKHVGIAFYGGSFTGLEVSLQRSLLGIALKYKNNGKIDHIRLSTRPDYIDDAICAMLKSYGVDLVELGVQSFDSQVLVSSGRGHQQKAIYDSIHCLKNYGMAFGIQLMFGLPGDNRERFFFSVEETIRLKPDTVRIYPTLVLKDTQLASQFDDGFYQPPTLDEALEVVSKAFKLMKKAGLNVIRVGLQATDLIDFKGSVITGPYHPAFKDLVIDEIVYQKIFGFINTYRCEPLPLLRVEINPKMISHVRGHKKNNERKLTEAFGKLNLDIQKNEALSKEVIILTLGVKSECVSLYQ